MEEIKFETVPSPNEGGMKLREKSKSVNGDDGNANSDTEKKNDDSGSSSAELDDSKIFAHLSGKLGREIKTYDELKPSQTDNIEPIELDDEKVLAHLSGKLNREIKSYDELIQKQVEALSPEVEGFAKYHKETGRGIEDYMRVNRDFSKVDDDTLIQEYYKSTEDDIDDDMLRLYMKKFKYDEDVDDEEKIDEAKILKRQALLKAKKFFSEQKEKYRIPLASRESEEEFNAYKEAIARVKTQQEKDKLNRDLFLKETDKVFGEGFKGFEFTIQSGDEKKTEQKILFPVDGAEAKKSQIALSGFLNKFWKDGEIKDALNYHKSLAVAFNPEKVAQFFYDKAYADAVEYIAKKSKNIDMNLYSGVGGTKKEGVTYERVQSQTDGTMKLKTKV
jgi:hypothetical protein